MVWVSTGSRVRSQDETRTDQSEEAKAVYLHISSSRLHVWRMRYQRFFYFLRATSWCSLVFISQEILKCHFAWITVLFSWSGLLLGDYWCAIVSRQRTRNQTSPMKNYKFGACYSEKRKSNPSLLYPVWNSLMVEGILCFYGFEGAWI